MPHALIIGNDGAVSRTIEQALAAIGFDSFERAWSEAGAVAAAERRVPDLVVVGEALDQGCPIGAARSISGAHGVPVLMAARPALPRRPLPADARLSGPFPVRALAEAVHEAGRTPTSH
jgi:hypothetical protein